MLRDVGVLCTCTHVRCYTLLTSQNLDCWSIPGKRSRVTPAKSKFLSGSHVPATNKQDWNWNARFPKRSHKYPVSASKTKESKKQNLRTRKGAASAGYRVVVVVVVVAVVAVAVAVAVVVLLLLLLLLLLVLLLLLLLLVVVVVVLLILPCSTHYILWKSLYIGSFN